MEIIWIALFFLCVAGILFGAQLLFMDTETGKMAGFITVLVTVVVFILIIVGPLAQTNESAEFQLQQIFL